MSPEAVNFHFTVSLDTVCAEMGSEVEPARVPQTFPPNIGQAPASPWEQSRGAGGIVVTEDDGAGVVMEGADGEEPWHAGSTSATETMIPTPTTGPTARRMYRFPRTRVRNAAATRFICFGPDYQGVGIPFLTF